MDTGLFVCGVCYAFRMNRQRKGFTQHLLIPYAYVRDAFCFSSRGVTAERSRKGAGFTLVELLVVIAIIGILSAIILASMSGARSKGRDAKRVADIKQLTLALQLYYDGASKYPSGSGTVASTLGALVPSYLPVMPTDPQASAGKAYGYIALPAGCANCTDYAIGAQLENSAGSLDGYVGDQPITINGAASNCNAANVYCAKP